LKLSVFGGTRGTGLQLVEKALAAGNEVTALARQPNAFQKRFPNVHTIQGDAFDFESVKAAVKGSDAVISTLGVVGRAKETKIYSEGVVNIASAMKELGPKRLIVLAASQGINPHPSFPWYASIMMKLFVEPMFGYAYRDTAKMTELISQSDLDWTLVGVPMLTNSSGKGHYRSSTGTPLHHAFQISRADAAQYLLSILNDSSTFRKWTEIAW
jgi:putative NADH-flavin reductase